MRNPFKKSGTVAPKPKLRPIGEIEADLKETCLHTGDLQFRILLMQGDLQNKNRRLVELNQEHARTRETIAKEAEDAARKLAHQSPPKRTTETEEKPEIQKAVH